MKPTLTGFVTAWLLLCGAAQAAEVEGVKLADKVQVGGAELVLNGAGVRTRVFFKVYVGALYLRAKSTAATTSAVRRAATA